jgi:hypothetical protein
LSLEGVWSPWLIDGVFTVVIGEEGWCHITGERDGRPS